MMSLGLRNLKQLTLEINKCHHPEDCLLLGELAPGM